MRGDVLSYVVWRIIHSIPLVIGVSIIGFGIMHLAPGGPLAVYTLNPTITVTDIERIRVALGLDQPVHIQYLTWAKSMLTGTWGFTFFGGRPVLEVIVERLPATMILMGTSLALAMLIGTLIGMLGAIRRGSIFDYLSTTGAMLALSFPTFWFGLMAIYIFAIELRWLPSGGMYELGEEGNPWDLLRHLVLPAMVLTLVLVAQWSRYARSSFLDVIQQDYIRTARSKGLSTRAVLFGHAFRNAVIPLVALFGVQLPTLFSGALVAETIFSWPGMGRLFVDALNMKEYPILMGMIMFTALFVVVGNLIADIAIALIDPRVKLG
ncbi:diguanylate cyclase [Bosea sp. Root483D1]|jgi:peptide/nickel transport system permease protein|uniref:ABC transporter permease n=1 Tax=Bosea sp. Root483D1 TaxID=1736544 RepID=UPI00070DF0D5|nr:ABC transporter permease [Bosea sp. Root483D1]KRE24437.1 diguanylate cyclase [Bosea sp. Root483D1]